MQSKQITDLMKELRALMVIHLRENDPALLRGVEAGGAKLCTAGDGDGTRDADCAG